MSAKWQVHRRTFLRGLGAAVSLPVLESAARFCADLDPARAARLLGAAVGNREAVGTPRGIRLALYP